jgi:hypothetical protein
VDLTHFKGMGCVIFKKNRFFENFFWKTGKFRAVFGDLRG